MSLSYRRWPNASVHVLAIAILFCLGPLATAAHVTDKLLVGLYAKPDSTTPPIELLESGTALNVLSRQNGYTKVKVANGKEGWLESSYVTETKPASMRLLEVQAELITLRRQLESQQGSVANPRQPIDPDLRINADITPPQASKPVQRYGPWIIGVMALFAGIAVGVGFMEYRFGKQLTHERSDRHAS